MSNTNLKRRYHAFFVLFNPSEEVTPWDDIEGEAVNFFLDFANQREYGTIPTTLLHFHVDEEMDLSKQEDNIQTTPIIGFPPIIQITAHFDYKKFTEADWDTQFKITVNGILFIMKFWLENLKVPKNIPLKDIMGRYIAHLEKKGLLIPEEEWNGLYFKAHQSFRFYFVKDLVEGLQKEQILFDTRELELILTNSLSNVNLGKSVKECCFLYNIFDYTQPDAQKKYNKIMHRFPREKDQILMLVQPFDSNRFLYDEQNQPQTKAGQIRYVREGLLEAIERIQVMKKKPKDFNAELFYAEVDRVLTEYEKENCL